MRGSDNGYSVCSRTGDYTLPDLDVKILPQILSGCHTVVMLTLRPEIEFVYLRYYDCMV